MRAIENAKPGPTASFSSTPFFTKTPEKPSPFFAKDLVGTSPFFAPSRIATAGVQQSAVQGNSPTVQHTFGTAQPDGPSEVGGHLEATEERLVQKSTPVPSLQMSGGGAATAPPTCNISPAMFTVSNATPQTTGNVSAVKNTADDTVTLTAPLVDYNANVQLNSSFCSDSGAFVDVGPVQTLNTSVRTGIYREGGRPGGRIVATQKSTMSNKRDAVWTDSTGVVTASFPEPWYSRPSRLSNLRQSTVVPFADRPEVVFPLRIGTGVLVETQGSDNFTVSLSAKKDTQLLHLESNNWSVPWEMDLTATTVGLPVGVINSLLGPSVTTGDIAMVSAQEWVSFPTVADALAADLRTLLDNMEPTFQNDILSHLNIKEALVKKNMQADFVITVNETAEWFGNDEVAISVIGTAIKKVGPFDLGDGDSQAFTVALNDFYPTGFFLGADIILYAGDEENTHGKIEWEFPYYPQRTPANFSGEEGEYTLTGIVS